jgi:predicted cation transporter
MDLIIVSLAGIMGAVLVLPFSVKKVEEELEAFLLVMGALAVTVSGQWSGHLVAEALHEPVKITLAVLVFGVIFKYTRGKIRRGVAGLARKMGMGLFLFCATVFLGLASSIITAIIAALVLVELISGLKLPKANETKVVVYACFSIGLGAALTPIGEPLSTIAVSKLAGPPHNADFFFLLNLLGKLVLPGVLIMGALAGLQGEKLVPQSESLTEDAPERMKDILLRTAKVYVFVAALVLLSTGIAPIVDRYILGMPRELLYWVNSISAVLDNATLAAAEISPKMERTDIQFLLMGLLISGGMLIPGNIPNIVCASKLDIKSGAWAKVGLPVGLIMMVLYFLVLEIAP